MSRSSPAHSPKPLPGTGTRHSRVDQRAAAWEQLRCEMAAAGFPAPVIRSFPVPFEQVRWMLEVLPPADLERRYLDNALLLQEAEWFLRELSLSLAEVPHLLLLLDREGWILRLTGDDFILARMKEAGVVQGSRAAPDSVIGGLNEVSLCDGQPAVALFPEFKSSPGWTLLSLPLHLPPQGNAGLLAVGYSDRRVSRRVYSHAYTASAAIERQMLWSDRLAQADRLSLVGTMISQIVHEVKNPLAAMKAALQLAKNSRGEEFVECFHLLNKEIEELNALVENLLGLAKPAPAHFGLQCLETILEEVLGLIRYEAALRNIRIDFRPGRTASFLRCDSRLLKQAFLNLARNAVQAMPQGGTLTLAAHRNARRGGATVEVVDTGVGISPENLAHLFEPFFTTKGTAGTGLGLSVTRKIICEVHQGDISVESTLGTGTRFTAFLPFNPEVRPSESAGA